MVVVVTETGDGAGRRRGSSFANWGETGAITGVTGAAACYICLLEQEDDTQFKTCLLTELQYA